MKKIKAFFLTCILFAIAFIVGLILVGLLDKAKVARTERKYFKKKIKRGILFDTEELIERDKPLTEAELNKF